MNITGLEIRFHGPVAVAALLGVSAVYIMFTYRRFLKQIGFPGAVFPLALRASSFISVILMVLGPVVYFKTKEPAQKRIAVLLDTSQSMSVTGSGGSSRIDGALSDLKTIDGELRGNPGIYSFDEILTETAGAGALDGTQALGKRTMLWSALDSVLAKGGAPLTDIVILTDGADTSGMEKLPGGPARVHTIIYGDADEFVNVGLSGVRAPQYGFVDAAFSVKGEIYISGITGEKTLGVELFEDGVRVNQADAEVSGAGGGMYGFSLSYTPKRPGVREMEVRVKTPEPERVTEDNSYRFFADIISERHRVLLVDSPSWEFKFVKKFLEGLEKPVLDVVLLGPEKIFAGSDARKALSDMNALEKYRLVIAGGGAGYLSKAERIALAEYLKSGGRVVLMGGAGSLLESAEWRGITGAAGGGLAGDADGFEVTLTDAGDEDSLMRIGNSRAGNREAWKTLPFVQTFHKITPPAGSLILAAHPWMKCGGKGCPMIYRAEVSRGMLLVFAFQGVWRWSFVDRHPDYYEKLWTNILEEFFDTERRRPVRIMLEENTITLGDSDRVSVAVDEGILEAGELPVVKVSGPGMEEVELQVSSMENDSVEYEVVFRPVQTGVYEMKVMAGGIESEAAHLAVNVSPTEYERIAPDRESAAKLCEKTGGVEVRGGEAGKILEELRKSVTYEEVRGRSAPWATVAFMLLVAAALAGEWILRRRGGLT